MPQPPATSDAGTRSRRTLFAAAASAVLGALGVAAARPAAAAAGDPVLLGRTNAAGRAVTRITSSDPLYGFHARGTAGAGALLETSATGKWGARARSTATTTSASGGALLGEGLEATGILGTTASNLRYGVHGRNTDGVTASGGAVRAEGRRNVGLFADTALPVDDVPAVVAYGGDGEFAGIALVAGGTTYLDGMAKALRSYVGVLAADSQVEYAPVVSGESDYHTWTSAVTLDGSGAATVTLPAAYRATVSMSTLRVGLTPIGAAMPNLHATVTGTDGATGFGIAGGVAAGTVHATVSAVRLALSLQGAGAAAGATAQGGAEGPTDGARRVARRARVPRGRVTAPPR